MLALSGSGAAIVPWGVGFTSTQMGGLKYGLWVLLLVLVVCMFFLPCMVGPRDTTSAGSQPQLIIRPCYAFTAASPQLDECARRARTPSFQDGVELIRAQLLQRFDSLPDGQWISTLSIFFALQEQMNTYIVSTDSFRRCESHLSGSCRRLIILILAFSASRLLLLPASSSLPNDGLELRGFSGCMGPPSISLTTTSILPSLKRSPTASPRDTHLSRSGRLPRRSRRRTCRLSGLTATTWARDSRRPKAAYRPEDKGATHGN